MHHDDDHHLLLEKNADSNIYTRSISIILQFILKYLYTYTTLFKYMC